MPVLEISDGKGNLLPEAGFVLTATAVYARGGKEDARKRDELVTAFEALHISTLVEDGPEFLEIEGDPAETIEGLMGLVNRLVKAPLAPLRKLQTAFDMFPASDLVSMMLLVRISLAHHPDYDQDRFAIELLQRSYEDEDVPTSSSKLKKAWPRFKPASHLRFALGRFERVHGKELFLLPPPGNEAKFREVIALSEAVRLQAESAGVLPANTTWRAPSDLDFPTVDLPNEPLGEEDLEYLRSESPKRKRHYVSR